MDTEVVIVRLKSGVATGLIDRILPFVQDMDYVNLKMFVIVLEITREKLATAQSEIQ